MDAVLQLEAPSQQLTGKRATFHDHLHALYLDPYTKFSSIATRLSLSAENASLPEAKVRVPLSEPHVHPELAAIYAEAAAFD